ncbi:hypothetical protein [Micromonospora arida]
MLALTVAMPALVVATVTYRDQQEINRAQLESTQLERQRYEQRYASRVAVWANEDLSGGTDTSVTVKVQNRSPVPIREVSIQILDLGRALVDPDRETSYRLNGDIPPCSLLTFQLADSTRGVVSAAKSSVSLSFSDTVGDWHLGHDGLVQGSGWRFNPGRAVEMDEQRQTAEDCGEGG